MKQITNAQNIQKKIDNFWEKFNLLIIYYLRQKILPPMYKFMSLSRDHFSGLCLLQSEARVLDIENWVHLTYPLSPETPVYKMVYEPMKINEEKSVATDVFDIPKLNGTFISWRFLEFYEHTGTHVDAPRHFCEDCKTEDELTWEELTGPLVVIDVRYLVSYFLFFEFVPT